MNGLFALYYTGREGSGHLCLMINSKNVVSGMDPHGALIRGEFDPSENGGGTVRAEFCFLKGETLVTGQTLESDLVVPYSVQILPSTFEGGTQLADFPMGPVNFRIEKLCEL